MARDELEIEIDASGAVKITTHGVKGKRCLEYQDLFRELLGPVESSDLTAEYNQTETQSSVESEVTQRVRRLEF